MPYHHGDLRRVLLAEAASSITEQGVAALSLRDLARRAGVSNAAPAYHFTDKTGLLVAFAAAGFAALADMVDAVPRAGGIVEAGVAYVTFALSHPAHFEVMFRPALLRDDAELETERKRAYAALADRISESGGGEIVRTAAWSLVHGYATLVLSGAVSSSDAGERAREIATVLFGQR